MNKSKKVILLMSFITLMPVSLNAIFPMFDEVYDRRLADASYENDTQEVERLITEGADVNSVCNGATPLMWAATGSNDVVKMLLAQNANPNFADKDGTTPLMIAAKTGSDLIVQLLLNAGVKKNTVDRHGHNALFYAQENPDQYQDAASYEKTIRLLSQ